MAHVLVTGAAGFVGSHLCERLIADGHTVTGVDAFIPYYPRALKEENLRGLRAQPAFTFVEMDLRNGEIEPLLEGADAVVPGFNIEEATTFPDNTEDFLQALSHSFRYSTANGVKAHCFTTALSKSEIVALGKDRALPFAKLWPCYFAEEQWCGQCESCLRFQRALRQNNIQL